VAFARENKGNGHVGPINGRDAGVKDMWRRMHINLNAIHEREG